MESRIKTSKTWKRHLPQKPRRVQRGFYSEQKNSSQKKVLKIILGIFIILIIQSIFQIKYLQVDKIVLQNNQDLTFEDINGAIDSSLTANKLLVFKKNNFFLLDTDELKNILLENFNLDDVTVVKKYPDILEITVTEKISQFIWQKDDSIYLLDNKGVLNRQIRGVDQKYLILKDFRTQRPVGDQIFSNNEIETINQIYLLWDEMIGDSPKLANININDTWDLELHTEIGFYVKVDINEDISQQLSVLKEIISENITGIDIDYIDVRFGDKVYFK
ncbi:FtsQ-type POTRA domain-containing protein [Candidatus Parcubacteria bacterium]|jgi:cell division septal protein FtsQ|nr:FtsQ-type POTRA domain-containing protein [Candidatus Parcubacteria bacterium]MBT7228078.1 FtsQ-type POTRA domain-containing protein [Candidatus Parcubacteria bacterium]